MKIQLLSDLHLEVHPHFVPEPAPGADVLVLAGDIGSYQPGSLLQGENFGLERFSPLPQYAGWPCPVVFVPGTAGFCNVLDELLPFADLWLHGHLHSPSDYVAEGLRGDGSAWRCHVVANPLGYARKGEQEGFLSRSTIDVPEHAPVETAGAAARA
jgi:hypothetical protein